MPRLPDLPPLDEAFLRRRLELPSGRSRIIIDTDAFNEIDDQFAIAYAILSPDDLDILGMTAAPYARDDRREPQIAAYDALLADANVQLEPPLQPYAEYARRMIGNDIDPRTLKYSTAAEGMELSYQEILNVNELLGADYADRSYRGSERFLTSYDDPVDSASARFIIETAMAQSPEDPPIYILAIGALTNIASAILMEPRIRERIVVSWTSSYPSFWDGSNARSYNLVQDPLSSSLLYGCGVPFVYLPGYYVGETLSITLPDMDRWVKPHGRIGAYLYHLFVYTPLAPMWGIPVGDTLGRSWVIWDLINFAWQMRPDWVPSRLRPAVLLDDDLVFRPHPQPYPMREAYGLKRDAVYADFFRKLAKHASETA